MVKQGFSFYMPKITYKNACLVYLSLKSVEVHKQVYTISKI